MAKYLWILFGVALALVGVVLFIEGDYFNLVALIVGILVFLEHIYGKKET